MLNGINQTSQMASLLFSRLDTKSQGYIEKSDLASAFSELSTKAQSTSSSSVDDVFSTLDSDSDGKVTKDEFSKVLAQLQEQLESQFSQSRMHGAGGHPGGPQGMPPPPPANDAGFTKEELTSQLQEADGSDKRTDLISKVVNNFEAADTDSDGKVSFKEAMAYDKSTQTASESSTSASSNNSDAQVMMKIMQLLQAYGSDQSTSQSSLATTA